VIVVSASAIWSLLAVQKLTRSSFCRFDPRSQFTDDDRPVLACQDVLNIKLDRFGQTPQATNEVGNRAASRLPSDPGQRAVVAWDLELDIVTAQRGDVVRIRSFAYSGLAYCFPLRWRGRLHGVREIEALRTLR
jgi:hypothetical protein